MPGPHVSEWMLPYLGDKVSEVCCALFLYVLSDALRFLAVFKYYANGFGHCMHFQISGPFSIRNICECSVSRPHAGVLWCPQADVGRDTPRGRGRAPRGPGWEIRRELCALRPTFDSPGRESRQRTHQLSSVRHSSKETLVSSASQLTDIPPRL